MNYSQNNEQSVILKYFKGRKGYFVDIGANDGETLSNTRALAIEGWSGVCVEPEPIAFDKLHNLYKDSKVSVLNGAISDKDGIFDLMASGSHLGKGDTGLLSSLKSETTKKWANETFEPVLTQCYTWKRFLKIIDVPKIDFISIDAEGMDWEILKQIDLTNVDMVCIEHNSDQWAFDCVRFHCNGYGLDQLLLNNLENVIWARS